MTVALRGGDLAPSFRGDGKQFPEPNFSKLPFLGKIYISTPKVSNDLFYSHQLFFCLLPIFADKSDK